MVPEAGGGLLDRSVDGEGDQVLRLCRSQSRLDQRVKEGELDIVFDDRRQAFSYTQPDQEGAGISLTREPSWSRVTYRP